MEDAVTGIGIYWSGVRRGLGLGVILTLLEALKSFVFTLKVPSYQPVKVILISIGFNLLVGMLIGLLAAPLLKLHRGWLWHALCSLTLASVLLFAARTPFDVMLQLDAVTAAGAVVLYGFGLWLARGAWRTRIAVALSVITVVAAYGLPYWLAPPQIAQVLERERLAAAAGAPNVMLIVLDTVRADRLDLMGYHRRTFPWLGEFAREGATFERALSAASWTVPSHASIFTGLFPSGHGTHHENFFLSESRTTLAEILYHHGWTTVSLSANPWISNSTGLTQGFALEEPVWQVSTGPLFSLAYRVAWHLRLVDHDHSGRQVTRSWLQWLDDWSGEQPFFAFLNYVEPHFPFHQLPTEHLTTFAPADVTMEEIISASQAVMVAEEKGERLSEEEAQRVNDLYDAAIHYQADLVREAIEAVRSRGILDQTIVIVVSDHGELLGEYEMFTHNRSLSEYLLAVPLVIRYPPRVPPGLLIEAPVTTGALLPTVLDMVGLPPAENIHTRSFAPLFEGDVDAARSPLLAEQYRDAGFLVSDAFEPRSVFDRLNVRYRSIEEDGWKLVVDSEGSHWLFRPREEPMESTDFAEEHPEVVERLMARLSALVDLYGFGPLDAEGTGQEGDYDELDPAVRERLRALGYVGS